MSPKSVPTSSYYFDILRYDATTDGAPRFDTYEVAVAENSSVLEAILKIQDEQDPSLAFRYSCRGAICGSCGMSINGRLDLACRVLLKNLHTDRVVLEPLPNFRVIRDLVVDMDAFWEKYERVRPWLHAQVEDAKESIMSEEQREKVDQYFSCILCGVCYGACPVVGKNEKFTGPAVLAKLYRFFADAREDRDLETLEQENNQEGVWGCHTITRCIEACPKNVRPTDGITGLRRKLFVQKIKSLFGKETHED